MPTSCLTVPFERYPPRRVRGRLAPLLRAANCSLQQWELVQMSAYVWKPAEAVGAYIESVRAAIGVGSGQVRTTALVYDES